MNYVTPPSMHPVAKLARADWAPHIEQAVRAIATAAAFVYVCGYITGQWLHRLNDSLALWVAGRHYDAADAAAGALALQQFKASGERSYSLEEVMAELDASVLYRCAAVPARCGIQAPTPMARAIVKVRSGMSQRQAAALCGVSRSSLQRALKG